MNILFYTPFFSRSRDTESLMISFKNSGHNVYYVSQFYGEEIQQNLKSNHISIANTILRWGNSKLDLIREILFLAKFCRKNKIDIVFSHLEPAHLVAVLAQYFIKAKVYICRHHIDEIHLLNKNKLLSYKLVYTLGKRFIVVSRKAKEFMVEKEHVAAAKIDVINLAYDFSLYPSVNTDIAENLRRQHSADIVLVTACRMVKDKRPELSVALLENLLAKKIDVKLFLLGDGPMKEELQELVRTKGLTERCVLPGRVSNILDYLSASDILVHPSIADSSSVIVKEAGLLSKIAIVCKGIGDFDDYLIHKQNAVLVDKSDFIRQAEEFIVDYSRNKDGYKDVGASLNKDVHTLFSIENNIDHYNKYFN
ncbi:MAG: glycosyltransferase [Cytophagaceae bacterium]|jgi:glycosyltransferase involved in cell wall biosynthesis